MPLERPDPAARGRSWQLRYRARAARAPARGPVHRGGDRSRARSRRCCSPAGWRGTGYEPGAGRRRVRGGRNAACHRRRAVRAARGRLARPRRRRSRPIVVISSMVVEHLPDGARRPSYFRRARARRWRTGRPRGRARAGLAAALGDRGRRRRPQQHRQPRATSATGLAPSAWSELGLAARARRGPERLPLSNPTCCAFSNRLVARAEGDRVALCELRQRTRLSGDRSTSAGKTSFPAGGGRGPEPERALRPLHAAADAHSAGSAIGRWSATAKACPSVTRRDGRRPPMPSRAGATSSTGVDDALEVLVPARAGPEREPEQTVAARRR